MKMLLIDCVELDFKKKRKSNRPNPIKNIDSKTESFKDFLAIFICVEKWDDEKTIFDAVEIVRNHSKMIKKSKVSVIPFVHLSNHIAKSDIALQILDKLENELIKNKFKVEKSSFGYHKEFVININNIHGRGYPGSIVFRRIPYDINSEIKILLKEYGIKHIKSILDEIEKKDG